MIVVQVIVVYNFNEVNKMLSKRLRELRTNKGLKQSDLAKILSISTSRYGQYETGRRSPDYNLLIQIADFYNVSIDYLLGRTNVIKPENIEDDDLLVRINSTNPENKAKIEQFLNFLTFEEEQNAKKNGTK